MDQVYSHVSFIYHSNFCIFVRFFLGCLGTGNLVYPVTVTWLWLMWHIASVIIACHDLYMLFYFSIMLMSSACQKCI